MEDGKAEREKGGRVEGKMVEKVKSWKGGKVEGGKVERCTILYFAVPASMILFQVLGSKDNFQSAW